MYRNPRRPGQVTVLTILFVIMGVGWFALSVVISDLLIYAAGAATLCCGVSGILGILDFIAAYGLWALEDWGRGLAIGLAVVGLIAVPIGTIIGIITLILLFEEETRVALGAMPEAASGGWRVGYPLRSPPPGYPQVTHLGPTSAPPIPTPPPSRMCTSCGTPLDPGNAFCPNCGSRVT
jgi:hypothetical protein